MRRVKTIIFLMLFTCMVYGQAGSGTEADPFRGDISSSVTWSSGVYPGNTIYIGTAGIPNLNVVSGGELTVQAGLTLIFTQANSNLIVTGTGVLDVRGTAGNMVVFTKKSENSGWGHISFQTMNSAADSSFIDFAIIEYGDVRTAAGSDNPNKYGGGLHLDFSKFVLSNTILRHNKALWGGALFVNQDRSPKIINCYVHDNSSNRGGGGFYFWNRAGSVINNTLFVSNHCLEPSISYYTGGGISAQLNTSITIVNCTFVNNTSTRPEGQALLLHSSSAARVVNSVFWGSGKQIYGYGTSGGVISHSAIEGTVTHTLGTGPVNSFQLAATNTAPDGPNFINPSTGDWRFTFFSPLRDAGGDSFTGITVPATDYDGNPRIYIPDIGAYEYQYSRWSSNAGTTDWGTSANWHGGIPGSNRDVIIPATADNFPTTAPGPDVIIGADRHFIMEPGARLTVNSLTNNGNLLLRASETEHSSLIAGSHTGSNANIEIYLRSGTFTTAQGEFNRWHFISSPFTSLGTGVFTGTTLNLAQWVENFADPSLIMGWVAFDGYNYGTGTMTGPTFTNLIPGTGYNYYHSAPLTYTLAGQINTSNVSRTLSYTNPDFPSQYGLNLTGNPFPSGLNWDAITSDLLYPENTSKVLHYTKDDEHVYYNNGIGSLPGMNGIIPPMQGFFVKTDNDLSPSIILPTSARVHDNIPQRYKGHQTPEFVRISLFSDDLYSDNTVIRFDNDAKEGFDYDFDAVKHFISQQRSSLYTFTEGKRYAINGLPYPDGRIELPLHIKILSAGTYTIGLSEIEGLANYRVRLIDMQENANIDLKVTPGYSFTSPEGTITNRFMIVIADLATNTEIPAVTEGEFRTYQSSGMINIITENEVWDGISGSVTLIDITGRRIATNPNMEFRRGTPTQVAAPGASGIYIVEITSGQRRWTGRIIIRH